MRTKTTIALCVALALSCVAQEARAGGCCGGGYGLGQRLDECETFAIATSVRAYSVAGAWDRAGRWSSGGLSDDELRFDASVLARLSPRVQLGASSWVESAWKRAGTLHASGGGVGDVIATGRFDLLGPHEDDVLPGLALTLSVLAPTGRAPWSSRDALGADVTGVGAWEVRPGIAIERWWSSWYGAATISLGARLPARQDDGHAVLLAPRGTATLAGGHAWSRRFSTTVGAMAEWEHAPSVAGSAKDDVTRLRTSAFAIGAWAIDDWWTITLAAQLEVPLDDFGRADVGGRAVTIGLRRAWIGP